MKRRIAPASPIPSPAVARYEDLPLLCELSVVSRTGFCTASFQLGRRFRSLLFVPSSKVADRRGHPRQVGKVVVIEHRPLN